MASDELARWGMGALGEQATAAALASFLALTYDAVVLFDDEGTILLANDEAQKLFRAEKGQLVGTNVRLLFVPAATVDALKGPLSGALPFPLDGTTTPLTCTSSDHTSLELLVRCGPVLAPGIQAYVLVAHRSTDVGESENRERLVEELSRANRRLSGTLRIVLGTLDSLDVGTLFSRVLDEITHTVDAWATLAYVDESNGYRLRGQTSDVEGAPVPAFLPHGSPLADLASRMGQATIVHVVPPSREELRKGSANTRTVVEERTGATIEVPTQTLPPFPSFVLLPVWFGGHMIALLEVGWRHLTHRLRNEDAQLLDAVSEYLSVQLAGAFAAFRAQRADALESLGTTLRERLMAHELTPTHLAQVLEDAAEGLDTTLVLLEGNAYQPTTMGRFPQLGETSVPVDLRQLAHTRGVPYVGTLEEQVDLCAWAQQHTDFSQGVIMLACVLDNTYYGCLLLRTAEDEPFEDMEVSFVQRLAEDVRNVREGERVRSQDKRIALALQRGMRNELQHIEGVSAQSCFSSATEAALVGGDFYDLIRLPQQHACVIMGDVSGKGVEAASVSSAVKTALGAYSWEGLRPARMVSLLNEFLLGFARLETFATMFVGMIDLNARSLVYCSAGHPPALLVRAASGELVTLSEQSGVVGAFSGMAYRDGEVTLEAGDMLLLYTDGVTEARNPDGAFFGEDGLREVVSREVAAGFDGLCDRVLQDVRDFVQHTPDDDVALLCLRFDGLGPQQREGFWGS
ncbi:MAG: SpoIIE family protein phosphatase [Coriobacteriales bacterium]|nr:SpoIIE family protein phosphatase [Coriobacteriales bacterium]